MCTSCSQRSSLRHSWRPRHGTLLLPTHRAMEPLPHSLWLVGADSIPLLAAACATAATIGHADRGEVLEASVIGSDGTWARLDHAESERRLGRSDAFFALNVSLLRPFGGRADGRLWIERPILRECLLHVDRPSAWTSRTPRPRRALRSMETAPPLRALETSITATHVSMLIDRGYVVVDNAIPKGLCSKLRNEMAALEANGQMWSSHSYGGDEKDAGSYIPHLIPSSIRPTLLHPPSYPIPSHPSSPAARASSRHPIPSHPIPSVPAGAALHPTRPTRAFLVS